MLSQEIALMEVYIDGLRSGRPGRALSIYNQAKKCYMSGLTLFSALYAFDLTVHHGGCYVGRGE